MQSAESVINNVVYQWIGLFFGDGAMQRMSSVRPCVRMRETNIQRDQNIWGKDKTVETEKRWEETMQL